MSYATEQEIIDAIGEAELIQLTDRDNIGGIDYTILDAARNRADARINRYITAYLPLVNVPADFVQIHIDFTRYFLYKDNAPDYVQKSYAEGIAYLEKVASGKIPLAPDTNGVSDAKTVDDVSFVSVNPVFDSTGLDGF